MYFIKAERTAARIQAEFGVVAKSQEDKVNRHLEATRETRVLLRGALAAYTGRIPIAEQDPDVLADIKSALRVVEMGLPPDTEGRVLLACPDCGGKAQVTTQLGDRKCNKCDETGLTEAGLQHFGIERVP